MGSEGNSFKSLLGFDGCLQVDSVDRRGGLLFLWKDVWYVSVLSYSVGHVDARINSIGGRDWWFSGFYGNPVLNQCSSSWELLRRLRRIDDLPWVVRGDFNEILRLDEKLGESGITSSCIYFDSLFVISLHILILHAYTETLEAWSKEKFGFLGKSIQLKQEELEALFARGNEVGISVLIPKAEKELEAMLAREEIYWKQRSRIEWLKAGDKNSKFFCNIPDFG
ncbi:hypothetical protein ACOSQ4_025838 [Xanthoceras sorbifolium]